MCHLTTAAHPECSSTGLQLTQVLLHYTAPPLHALATAGCLNLVQGTVLAHHNANGSAARPLHSATANRLALPHYNGVKESRLHNGGKNSPLISGQPKLLTSSAAN